jgi:type I restriction enzyme M protein
MNLAVRGIDADMKWNSEGSFHKDELRDLKADFILANPPFNISDWGGDRLREDVRWKYGVPPASNGNSPGCSISPIICRLRASRGSAREWFDVLHPEWRRRHPPRADRRHEWRAGGHRLQVALPGQFFYSTQIPVCLWFLARDKSNGIPRNTKLRNRRDEILFVDAQARPHGGRHAQRVLGRRR